jgi:hypothetical protein
MYGLHTVELKPGVNVEEFERFARTSSQQIPTFPGTRFTILKGERGQKVGTYLCLMEFESMEARDRILTESGFTEEGGQWYAEIEPLLEQWREYTTRVPGIDAPFTEYHDLLG